MSKKLLIVENDISLQTLLVDYFSSRHYEVFSCSKGSEVKDKINQSQIDIILLDVMLDDMDGWSVLRLIKKEHKIPVLMLTARSQEDDKIFGLELGADDYITKPFSFKELELRVRNVYTKKSDESHDNIKLLEHAYEVQVNDTNIKLTKNEFTVFQYLYLHPKEIMTRERLLEVCWGYLYDGDTRTVDTTIKRIRHKLKMVSVIHTVFGVGYYYEVKA